MHDAYHYYVTLRFENKFKLLKYKENILNDKRVISRAKLSKTNKWKTMSTKIIKIPLPLSIHFILLQIEYSINKEIQNEDNFLGLQWTNYDINRIPFFTNSSTFVWQGSRKSVKCHLHFNLIAVPPTIFSHVLTFPCLLECWQPSFFLFFFTKLSLK